MNVETVDQRVSRLRALAGTSEVSLWPTCLQCMAETVFKPGGERWVPVEGYQIDPPTFQPFTFVSGATSGAIYDPETGALKRVNKQGTAIDPKKLFRPRERGTFGWFVVIAECHGKHGRAEVDIPRAWGVHHVFAAIQRLKFFGQETRPEHGLRTIYGGRA